MKHLLIFILSFLSLSSAFGQNDSIQTSNLTDSVECHNTVVIIYYDGEIGTKALDKVIKRNHCEVIYRYNNFNAYAIKIPNEAVRKDIENTKGVLSVQDDRILKLD